MVSRVGNGVAVCALAVRIGRGGCAREPLDTAGAYVSRGVAAAQEQDIDSLELTEP